jgi:thiol-disulfide isomerase/thioredoxin/Flp pilus assembly protein TadD
MTAPRLDTRFVRPGQLAALLATTLLLTGWIAQGVQDEVATTTARLRELYLQRDYETAIREGEAWLERAPEAFELRAWYALNLTRDGKADKGVAEAEAMVEADSANPWCWFALAGALNWHSERGEEALAASEKALAMSPDHIDFIWLRAAVIRSREGNAESVAFIDELPPDVQEHPLLLVRKGVALYYLSREEDETEADEAFVVFEQAREADPQNIEAHSLAGAYLLIERRVDDAYPLLKTAVALTPAPEVHRDYWRAVQGRDDLSTDEKRAEIEADVASLLERAGESPSALWAVATVYGDLELEEQKLEVEQRLLELYPDTEQTEWVLVYRYRAVQGKLYEEKQETGTEDPEKRERYRQMLVEFIDRPHHVRERLLGDAYRNLFHLIKDDPDVDTDYLYEVVDGMVKYEGINPHITHAGGAIALAEHKTHFEEAERLVRDGLVEAKKKIDEQNEWGLYETEGEYQRALDRYTSIMYDALGWVYFNQDRLEDAEEELLTAYDLYHESMGNLHHLGQFYETRYDLAFAALGGDGQEWPSEEAAAYLDAAEGYYIKGVMVQSPGENPNDDALKALYEKRLGTLEGYEDYLANAEEIDRERRHEKILAERLEDPEPIEPFGLKTLSGLFVPSSFLAGKLVVVNFWGTWCGPCVAEMPEIQKFHEKYREDPDVVFLTINNDDDPDDVREWMKKHEYDFAVLLDDGYNDDAGVHAYPTTWFIDRQGRIGFRKVGWSEALTEEFSWRVEALRGSEGG